MARRFAALRPRRLTAQRPRWTPLPRLRRPWRALAETLRLAVLAALVLLPGALVVRADGSGNFTGDDAAIVLRAEAARRDLALFWFDRPLPRWSAACPITVRDTDRHSGGGATSFSFDRGEVFGWRMTLAGPRQQILDSVVAHEVHHAVLASDVRRRLPRWLDEGLSAVFESPDEHAQHRRYAREFANHPARALAHADEMEYPTRPENVRPLYATGHSVVEWLLVTHGREAVLAFARDPRPPSASMRDHFGADVAELDRRWQRWIAACSVDCEGAGCPVHSHRAPVPQTVLRAGSPVMEVFTSKLCIPCAAFWLDHRTDAAFRIAIESRVRLVVVDAGIEPDKARARGITGVPSFVVGQTIQTGYPGKRGLVAWIDRTLAARAVPASPPPTTMAPPLGGPTYEPRPQPERYLDPDLLPPPPPAPGPFAVAPHPQSPAPVAPAPPSATAPSAPALVEGAAKLAWPKVAAALLPFLPEGVAAIAAPAALASGPVGIGVWAGITALRLLRRRRAGRGPPVSGVGPTEQPQESPQDDSEQVQRLAAERDQLLGMVKSLRQQARTEFQKVAGRSLEDEAWRNAMIAAAKKFVNDAGRLAVVQTIQSLFEQYRSGLPNPQGTDDASPSRPES
jgi:hypothetical protein